MLFFLSGCDDHTLYLTKVVFTNLNSNTLETIGSAKCYRFQADCFRIFCRGA